MEALPLEEKEQEREGGSDYNPYWVMNNIWAQEMMNYEFFQSMTLCTIIRIKEDLERLQSNN